MLRFCLFFLAVTGAQAICKLPEAPAGTPDTDAAQLTEKNRFNRAKTLLANPSTAPDLILRSRVEAGLGNLDASLKFAEQAEALAPGSAATHVQLAAACGRLAEKASMFKQLSLAHRAKTELDIALRLEPRNIFALYGLGLYYYAAPPFIGGDKQKAQQLAVEMTAIQPVMGHLIQARFAKERKDAAAEQSSYEKAIQSDANHYEARISLAEVKPDAAETLACEALALDPYRVEAWRILAESAVHTQCWNEMFEILRRARLFVPDDTSADYAAAEALVRAGMHYAWAEELLRQYIAGPREGDGTLLARANQYLTEVTEHRRKQNPGASN